MAIHLDLTLPSGSSSLPEGFGRAALKRLLLGLAPDEACHAADCYQWPGGLLHRRFTLTYRSKPISGLFSAALSLRSPWADVIRHRVESKMNRVTAIAPDAQRVQIVLSHEGNPRQADTAKRVEITVIAGRTVVRAEASSADEFSALDMALDKLTLRLRRTRDRRKDHRRGYSDPVPVDLGVVEPTPEVEEPVEVPNNSPAEAVAAELGPGESVEVQVGDTPIVIRRKLHIAEPMTIDEALYEMELIGHDFFLFVNKETGRPSVVYHRHGWSYGVFEIDTPENVAK